MKSVLKNYFSSLNTALKRATPVDVRQVLSLELSETHFEAQLLLSLLNSRYVWFMQASLGSSPPKKVRIAEVKPELKKDPESFLGK